LDEIVRSLTAVTEEVAAVGSGRAPELLRVTERLKDSLEKLELAMLEVRLQIGIAKAVCREFGITEETVVPPVVSAEVGESVMGPMIAEVREPAVEPCTVRALVAPSAIPELCPGLQRRVTMVPAGAESSVPLRRSRPPKRVRDELRRAGFQVPSGEARRSHLSPWAVASQPVTPLMQVKVTAPGLGTTQPTSVVCERKVLITPAEFGESAQRWTESVTTEQAVQRPITTEVSYSCRDIRYFPPSSAAMPLQHPLAGRGRGRGRQPSQEVGASNNEAHV
jgi:hypothetical protein